MSQYNDIFAGKLGLVIVYVSIIMAATAFIVFFVMAPTSKAHGYTDTQLSYNLDGPHKDNPCFYFEGTSLTIMYSDPLCSMFVDQLVQQGWTITDHGPNGGIYLVKPKVG